MNDKEFTDILRVEGINAKGYGIIPKLIMQDIRLTAVAKAIYAYFCSYAGAGNQAFPKVDTILYHLQISKNTYYTHFKLLLQLGYIKTYQTRSDGKKYAHTVYILNTNPKPIDKSDNSPCTKICDTENYTKKPCTNFRDTEKRDTEICDTNSISLIKLSFSKINQSIESGRRIDMIDLKNMTEYDILKHRVDKDILNEIIAIMFDLLNSTKKVIRVSKEDKQAADVKDKLLLIRSEHIQYIIECLNNTTNRITNIKNYIITSLYNAPDTIKSYYKSKANEDQNE